MSQVPSLKPYIGWYTYNMTASLIETQYHHIPSIRNGDAAYAARALVMLCLIAAQQALTQCVTAW